MPPQQNIFNSAIQEIHSLKDRYDQLSQEAREEGSKKLELHMLELPDIRSRDDEITSTAVTELLEGLQEHLKDDPIALRILNAMLEEEWINDVRASGPPLRSPTDKKGRHYIHSVIVTNQDQSSTIAHTTDTLNLRYMHASDSLHLHYDPSSEQYHIRTDSTTIPDIYAPQQPFTGAPALSIDPDDIIDISVHDQITNLKHAYSHPRNNDITNPPQPTHTKNIRLEFRSPVATERFLLELRKHRSDHALPLSNPLSSSEEQPRPPACGEPPNTIQQRLRSAYAIVSISIGLETLQAAEALYLSFYAAEDRYVVLGANGFSRLEWSRFSFSVYALAGRRYDPQGHRVTLVLIDGATVRLVMKSPGAVLGFQNTLECSLDSW